MDSPVAEAGRAPGPPQQARGGGGLPCGSISVAKPGLEARWPVSSQRGTVTGTRPRQGGQASVHLSSLPEALTGQTAGPGTALVPTGPACPPRAPALPFGCRVKSTWLVPQIRSDRGWFGTRCECPHVLSKFNETFAGFPSAFLANASHAHPRGAGMPPCRKATPQESLLCVPVVPLRRERAPRMRSKNI